MVLFAKKRRRSTQNRKHRQEKNTTDTKSSPAYNFKPGRKGKEGLCPGMYPEAENIQGRR
jgi:hypothetical protein